MNEVPEAELIGLTFTRTTDFRTGNPIGLIELRFQVPLEWGDLRREEIFEMMRKYRQPLSKKMLTQPNVDV